MLRRRKAPKDADKANWPHILSRSASLNEGHRFPAPRVTFRSSPTNTVIATTRNTRHAVDCQAMFAAALEDLR